MRIDPQEIYDRLEMVNVKKRERAEKGLKNKPLSRAEALGLSFKPGEKVLDKETKQEGEILDGNIEIVAFPRT